MKSLLNKKGSFKNTEAWEKTHANVLLGSLKVQKSVLKSLLADVSRLLPGTKGLERDLVTLETRLEHEGIGFLSIALGTLGRALDQGLEHGTFTTPYGFKHRKGEKIPSLLGGVFCKVFDSKTGDFIKGVDLTLEVSLLRQVLFFLEEVFAVLRLNPSVRVKGARRFHEM
jgi:hypothetical protein